MKRLLPFFLILAVLIVAGFFLWQGAWHFSPIIDETPHVAAGYSYVHFLDYRLNPEHPPLTKALAGLFLTGGEARFPLDNPGWQQEVNGQWGLGHVFLFASGNDPERLMAVARRGPILLTLLFILLFGAWLSKRLGPWWGAAGAALLGLSPFFLGHGGLITTDVAAAFGALLGIIMFGRYLEHPTGKRAAVAGLALGIAELCKFSLVLLLPAYLLIAVLYALSQHGAWRALWAGAKRFLVVAAIGYALVVYPVYALFTHHYPATRQARDTAHLLETFAGGPTAPGAACRPLRCVAEAVMWSADIPGARALSEYALGVLMVMQRSVGGNTNYFLGTVSRFGSWLYFPVVYLIKETLPALALLGAAGIYGALRFVRGRRGRSRAMTRELRAWLVKHPTEALMGAFIIIYWISSVQSTLNIGVRHLFPTIPLMYVLGLSAWRGMARHLVLARQLAVAALAALIVWHAGTALAASPYFLAYFNPFAGGTENGYRLVTDSNYDWGQDLFELHTWLEQHPEVDRIALDYFGGGDMYATLGDRVAQWRSSDGDPRAKDIHWLAVSISVFQNALQPTTADLARKEEDEYRWLTSIHPRPAGRGEVPIPDARVGTSFFIYYLP